MFFVFCILELAYVAWDPATLYNDIVWLLNQDTCQLRYKSWILSAPFAKRFQFMMLICEKKKSAEVRLIHTEQMSLYNFIVSRKKTIDTAED